MRQNFRYQIRRWHRYLGLLAGLQFLGWTVGGLYFSWSNMDEIHGDLQRREVPAMTWSPGWVSPDSVLAKLPAQSELVELKVINVLGTPTYQIQYHSIASGKPLFLLADVYSGQIRPALSRTEAIKLAKASFVTDAAVEKVEYLTTANVNRHHEYRKNPLPAWAITMDHPSHTTVYVAAALGTVTKFRNEKWRVFDFLWMLHTMDYQSRDHFGNWLLRAFSIAGVLTVLSGLGLYFSSSRLLRKR